MISTIQRFGQFLTPAAVLLTLGIAQLHGLQLDFSHFAAVILVDVAVPLELVIILLLLLFLLLLFFLLQLPSLTRCNERCASTGFVILILIHYKSWKTQSKDGHSMQLNSVKEDLRCLLDHLRYRHDDTTRTWYILTDFECTYRDYTGVERSLTRAGIPNRETILGTIEQATKTGDSGLIHFGGHCYYAAPGTSKLEEQGPLKIFTEKRDSRRGGKAAYLVCSDGQRIYGNEFFTRLPDLPNTKKSSTIILVFDTCNAAGFIADISNLLYRYEPESIPLVGLQLPDHAKPINQVIVVTSSRLHEKAVTYRNCGALTFFITEYLDCQERPDTSAIDLLQYLDARCATQPDEILRQHPQIWSRYPLNGPFSLLPRLL